MLLWVAFLQIVLPKRRSQSKLRCWCARFLSMSPVFKKAVILVYRENNKLKKKMVCIMFVMSFNFMWHKQCWNIAFLSFPHVAFFYVTRQTIVRHILTAIQIHSSSVGSSRSLRFRSDWEILQVRGRDTATLSPLNHSQSTSNKSFFALYPRYHISSTHNTHLFWHFYSAPSLLPYLLLKP